MNNSVENNTGEYVLRRIKSEKLMCWFKGIKIKEKPLLLNFDLNSKPLGCKVDIKLAFIKRVSEIAL